MLANSRRTKYHWKGITFILVTFGFGLITISYLTKHRSTTEHVDVVQSKSNSRTVDEPLAKLQFPSRPVYPYSVVPGGVHNQAELIRAIEHDLTIKNHYGDFKIARAHVVVLHNGRSAYVSYRVGENIYWTRRKLYIAAGEELLTDGEHFARTRCGNRISEQPKTPTSKVDPPPEAFTTPVQDSLRSLPGLGPPFGWAPPTETSATQPPFVPFVPFVPVFPGGGGIPSSPVVPDSPPSPVPEPGTMSLVAIGVGVLLRYRRQLRQ